MPTLTLVPAFFGQVTVPDIGVDVGAFVTAAITTLGAVAAIAVGGYVAFMIVRRGLRWMGTALR